MTTAKQPEQAKQEPTPEEQLQMRRAKQVDAINARLADPTFKRLRETPQDHATCKLYGYPQGALIKFRDAESGMISLFCDLGVERRV